MKEEGKVSVEPYSKFPFIVQFMVLFLPVAPGVIQRHLECCTENGLLLLMGQKSQTVNDRMKNLKPID